MLLYTDLIYTDFNKIDKKTKDINKRLKYYNLVAKWRIAYIEKVASYKKDLQQVRYIFKT